jgi:mono/diheme cytochrome c family protein
MIVRRLSLMIGLLLAASAGLSAQEEAAGPGAGGDVERGRYLVERVIMCGECHSTRGPDGAVVMSTHLKGGPMPVRAPFASADWPLQIPRIAGLPGYSDAEAIRLLTQGAIKRDGTQARMPMPRFRMTPEDAAAVVAYLRPR